MNTAQPSIETGTGPHTPNATRDATGARRSKTGVAPPPPAGPPGAQPRSPTIPDAIRVIRPQLHAWAARQLPAEQPELAAAVERLVKRQSSPATIELAIFSATGDRPLAKMARHYAEAIANEKETAT